MSNSPTDSGMGDFAAGDITASDIAARVQTAWRSKTPLNIIGAGTKSFLGHNRKDCEPLVVTGHHGIIEYDPAELVLVARAGTPLLEIESLLTAHNQMLGFEPPFVQTGATLGGAVAAGLAGPRRTYSGAVRDFVLGAGFVNGKGEIISVGGKVMKNVAGFDLFRPMARSMGTLGVLLSISLRVIPRPEIESTLLHEESDELAALKKMNLWAGQTQSISAAAWDGRYIRVRLSGSAASIKQCQALLGGQFQTEGNYWQDLNNFRLDFFRQQGRLWRVSVAPMSPGLGQAIHQLTGHQLTEHQPIEQQPIEQQIVDWGGAQRWIKSDEAPETIRSAASRMGGYAECFSEDTTVATYHPLEKNLLALSQRFKAALDPAGILNPGRLYPEL